MRGFRAPYLLLIPKPWHSPGLFVSAARQTWLAKAITQGDVMILDQKQLHSYFDYDPTTGFLTWKERAALTSHDRAWNTKYAGRRAGGIHKKVGGYESRQVWLRGKIYAEHRIIWAWMTGEDPPAQIDHRDRDATNNMWSNIRDADGKNNWNKSMRRDNRSGVTGVCLDKNARKWQAVLYVKGIKQHVGLFRDAHLAKSAVEDARLVHGFDPDHGAHYAHYVRSA